LANVYGLGALLRSLLTGSIRRDHAPNRDDAEIPRFLSAICDNCLAVDPSQRFQSVAELIGELGTLK
jgi:hypothetical protein